MKMSTMNLLRVFHMCDKLMTAPDMFKTVQVFVIRTNRGCIHNLLLMCGNSFHVLPKHHLATMARHNAIQHSLVQLSLSDVSNCYNLTTFGIVCINTPQHDMDYVLHTFKIDPL